MLSERPPTAIVMYKYLALNKQGHINASYQVAEMALSPYYE